MIGSMCWKQAVGEYELETGGVETARDHFIEWLAEWGRDYRRRQRGLLLLTAHRAKGLEFDHVMVLDGGWDKAWAGGGRGRPAAIVLRGHDTSAEDPCSRSPFRREPDAGRAPSRPLGAAPGERLGVP